MARDIFEEYPFRLDFPDDPGNVGPQVALVVVTSPLPGMAEWLAGISREDGIECAPERPSVECGDVIPYRGRGEISGALGGNEALPGVFLPFDKAAGVEARFGEHEAHIKPAASGAEREAVSGT